MTFCALFFAPVPSIVLVPCLPCHLVTTWQQILHSFLYCFALFFCIFMHSAILFDFFSMTLGGRGQRLQELLQKFIKLGLSYTTFWEPFRAILFCCLPRPHFGKICCAFLRQTFWIEVTPSFPENSLFFPPKNYHKKTQENRKWPPPSHFGNFLKIHQN